ncbi:MAG: response regulator [Candidatus Firestonebacteria bacterium]|nr:response regulator [Candidatus Firestonebacteria bacterium]
MQKNNIMVTDDARGIRESIKVIFEDHFNVQEASSGDEALEKLKTGQIFLVILDVLMPGMDGIETLEKIKAMNADVEVCMLTSVNDYQVISRVKELGAYDYVTKPFDVERIRNTILDMESRLKSRGLIPPPGFEKLN